MNEQRETNKLLTLAICFSILLVAIPAQIFVATPVQAVGPDSIFEGTVTLESGTFNVTSHTMGGSSGATYAVNNLTPLGALNAAAHLAGFGYNVSDKSYGTKGILLLDEIDGYWYNKSGSDTWTWICQVNGVTLDDFNNFTTDGLNIKQIFDGDQVDFYYGLKPVTPENATASVKITVSTGAVPGDWTLTLKGAVTKTVTKAEFEAGVACGHYANWTDPATMEFWEGMPLWYLVAMVDDDPDVGPDHFNFNDALAAEGYMVKVIASDWSAELDSADIARADGYIVANRLNGSELPLKTPSDKPCWPLHLKGPSVFGGQQVGGIVQIELLGLPEPPEGWALSLIGEVGDTITQAEFEEAVACHGVTYNDGVDLWEGVPLWYLCGAVDDLEMTSHWTFDDALANGTGYTVNVMAADGFNKNFASSAISRSNNYIVANSKNGLPLEYTFPLRLVGTNVTGGNKVGNISEIRLLELITPPPGPGSYNLNLTGKITDVLSQAEFEAAANPSCHGVTWVDGTDTWEGVPLWFFCGWVDDRIPHGPDGFNDPLAAVGYTITVKAGDGYQKQFESADVAHSNYGYIVANKLNGTELSKEGEHPPWPLRLVGTEVSGGLRVGNITDIILAEFETPSEAPSIHIIKYVSPTNLTILNETNVTYAWMEANLPVIGDGLTAYKFEGIDFAGDHWDQAETYPGGFKINNTVQGTAVRALCELVGGMGPGTEIALIDSGVAPYITRLGYKNIYTGALTPEQQERQGEAFLAWWDAQQVYVPGYADGYRLFFSASDDDHVFGLWDMHECLDEEHWHFYWEAGIQYPSCAGLSVKWVDTIKIYAEPEADWDLELEGAIDYTITKSYFEQGLACGMGDHKATYTDGMGRVWEGMPLWFLCGFVDDGNAHSAGAYNDALAAQGYNITVYARDGFNKTIDSRLTIRNNNYIVANSLNGSHFPADDANWPLRLVGTNVTGGLQIKAIGRIALDVVNASVYFEPNDVRVPAYCNTTTVGVWVNPEVAMGSGKLTFNYTFCCLNVTDFAFNTTNFDPGVSGTNTVATLTPGHVELFFATGAPAGVGPGPVHIGDATFHCCRESGEYCETELAWVPGYPDSYVEDTGATEITPVKYNDGVFRCNIPDLVITSVIGKKIDETHYTVNYTIENVGLASAAAGHLTSLSIDGVLIELKSVPDLLAPGEAKEYALDAVIALTGGLDTITVCADYSEDVIELDEENNCKDGAFPAGVVIRVIPAVTQVQPQDQFDVSIHIDPKATPVYGVQYTLTYDTSVLRAETQTKGPFLGTIGETMVVVNEIDQAHGIVEYAETRKVAGGVTTPGNVATIHFIAIGKRGDTSWLNLSDVIVVDVNKDPVPDELVEIENGMVEITDNQPPIAIGSSKFLINNVAKKYPSTAILCSCSYDLDWPGKGGNITYIRWAFGDGQYGTSEGLPVNNCTCKEHKYESWLWENGAYLPFDVLLTVTDDGCPEATNSTNFSVTVYIAGDANGDGEVNILDAVWVGKHWRQTCPATDYCATCAGYLWFGEQDGHWAQKDGADLNNDCEINILDAVVIGANWRHVAWE